MSRPVKAKCNTEQFEGLWAELEKTRSSNKFVKVDKDALRLLLADHGALWTYHNDAEKSEV